MTLSINIVHRLGDFGLNTGFQAPSGVTAIFGPSGAGKTSIVQAVSGLVTPDEGRIEIDGAVIFDSSAGINLAPQERRIGYVFQDSRLFPHMRVEQNLQYGLRAQNLTRDAELEAQIISLLGLETLLKRFPSDLSGGEKQRVALARALLTKPRLLLLDEPLAALDQNRRDQILRHLEQLRDRFNISMLYVSHSVSEVARLANHLVLVDSGSVVKSGPVEDVFSNLEAASLIGLREAGSVLIATVVQHHDDGLTELAGAGARLHLPRVEALSGDKVRLRIRASDVMLSLERPDGISALNVVSGQIVAVHSGQGPGVLVRIRCGDDHLIARVTRRSATTLGLSEGKPIHAVIKSVSVARCDIGA